MAPLAHLAWREAMVAAVVDETADARSLVLDVPHWPGHVAGQHVDVRLTAPDGYQATRSYSLSSGPGEAPTITVQEVEDGEVSTYLVRDIAVGDTLGVRGPIGGYFVWAGQHRPLLLVGGGSGLAPLRAMWRAADPTAPVVVLASVTTPARLLYATELADRVRAGTASATVHLSRVGRATGCRAHRHAARRRSRSGPVGSTRASVEAAVAACGGARGRPGRLRLRPDVVRRGPGRPARRGGPRPAHRAGRAVRLTRADAPDRARRHPEHSNTTERQVGTMSDHVDGNAVIGALSLALGTDVGGGSLECAGCGDTHEIARTHVYLRCPGMVLRCPGCGAVEVVIVEIRHRLTATLSGIAALRTGPAAAPAPA